MPVGSMSQKKYPEKLMKKEWYKEFLEFCNEKKDFKVIPHCSFDGMNSEKKHCNKGISKLGMGPTGDIYNCPWSEHLLNGSKKFYLGNIFESNIIESINNQDFSYMENNNFSCEIFNIVLDEDYLYKK
jgi:radical SAM protein with 4Fe4S-binding SPASM domain